MLKTIRIRSVKNLQVYDLINGDHVLAANTPSAVMTPANPDRIVGLARNAHL